MKVYRYNLKTLARESEWDNARQLDRKYGLYPDSFRKHIDIPYHEYKGAYWSKYKEDTYNDIYEKIEQHTPEEKDISAPQDIPYQISDGEYNIHSRHGMVSITIEQADKMFEDYSSKGLNMSQTQMIRKYNLKPYEWNAIKNALSLTKLSNIFSPWTVENTPAEEFESMVANKFSQAIDNRGLLIEKQYNKQVIKKYEQVIKEHQKNKFVSEHTMAQLSTLLPTIREVVLNKNTAPTAINDAVAYVADTHLGAKVKGLNKTPDFSPSILMNMLYEYADKINKLGAKRVHLRLLGDFVESFTGLNHKDSWKSMDPTFIGGKLIFEAYKMFLKFISSTNNVASLSIVPGNHDRMSSNKEEDNKGEIAEAIYLFLNETLGHSIDIKFDPIVRADVIDGICYIDTHGDKRNASKPSDMALLYGHNNMFNVIAKGHKHERAISHDSAMLRAYTIQSIFTGNFYSTSNGWTSVGGGQVFYNGGSGIPTVIDIPLSKKI